MLKTMVAQLARISVLVIIFLSFKLASGSGLLATLRNETEYGRFLIKGGLCWPSRTVAGLIFSPKSGEIRSGSFASLLGWAPTRAAYF